MDRETFQWVYTVHELNAIIIVDRSIEFCTSVSEYEKVITFNNTSNRLTSSRMKYFLTFSMTQIHIYHIHEIRCSFWSIVQFNWLIDCIR